VRTPSDLPRITFSDSNEQTHSGGSPGEVDMRFRPLSMDTNKLLDFAQGRGAKVENSEVPKRAQIQLKQPCTRLPRRRIRLSTQEQPG